MGWYENAMNAKTNSEIHASLRRLEDADYVYNQVQEENLSLVIDQSNEADNSLQSQINNLSSEVYQLHSYIEPHIMEGDLKYFQTLYVGNLQVDSGGKIGGRVTFTGNPITFEGGVIVDEGLDIYGDAGLFTPQITMGDEKTYTSHTLTVEGQTLTGNILATQDMSFSLAGLASGSWSGSMFKVETNRNHIILGSTTITARPHFAYNSSTHTYTISADATDENGTVHAVSTTVDSGDQAYIDGQDDASTSYPPNSATFEWFETVDGEPHFKRTDGDFFGRTSRVVYWD